MMLFFNIFSFGFEIKEQYFNDEIQVIGCLSKGYGYNYIATKPLINKNGRIYCTRKNIMLPTQSHLKIFKELYGDSNLKIVNRFALINFESAFNPRAKSPRNDYGYIQINNGSWSLGKIKESLERLDIRFKNHAINLCQNKYKIDINNNLDDLYKCLLMRHNGRRTLNNDYTMKAFVARNYYIQYFEELNLKDNIKIEKENELEFEKEKQNLNKYFGMLFNFKLENSEIFIEN